MLNKNMSPLRPLDSSQIVFLVTERSELKKSINNISQILEEASIYSQILYLFSQYDLGTVSEVYEIFGGYVNKSYGVLTIKNKREYWYFVRMYKRGIIESELHLEHSLIDFSITHGLDIAAGLIRTNNFKTFVKIDGRYFSIYDFLPGEDKYTWDSPLLNDKEYASAAGVLATFHNSARNFDPNGRERLEPKIMELLPMLPVAFKDYAERNIRSKFQAYFEHNLDNIIKIIKDIQIPEKDLKKMIVNPIHSDFHPGNLKFMNDAVVGVFDFDWCKIDLRLFDVCLALVYSCCSWENDNDGVLLLDKCKIFLEAYQDKLNQLKGLPPLNKTEVKHLVNMIAAANIYLINWTVNAYYTGSDLNVYEYLAYLQHNIRLMWWIENHKEKISEMVKTI